MMHRGHGMFGLGGILGSITIVIIAYFLITFFNQNKNNSNISRQNDKAIEILRERYASGEISEEEYKSKLNKLNE